MHYTLKSLLQEVETIAGFVNAEIRELPPQKLNQRPASSGWSILECLEHLNRYANYYLPELEKAIAKFSADNQASEITFSWLGKKSVEMILPQNARKQKTLSKMNPAGSTLPVTVLSDFLGFQEKFKTLLKEAATADLTRKTIPIEFFRLLKMNTGETLVFLVEHEMRHLAQLQRVYAEICPDKSSAA